MTKYKIYFDKEILCYVFELSLYFFSSCLLCSHAPLPREIGSASGGCKPLPPQYHKYAWCCRRLPGVCSRTLSSPRRMGPSIGAKEKREHLRPARPLWVSEREAVGKLWQQYLEPDSP